MRVIAGRLRGRRINAKLPKGVRPTTDRVKESLFSILTHVLDFEGLTVLDLFSGAGSLWIESLSRGASKAISVDKSHQAISYQSKAAKSLGVADSVEFVAGDAVKLAKELIEKHSPDIIFADPPYNKGFVEQICEELKDFHGYIVIESSPIEAPAMLLPTLGFSTESRDYGDSALTLAHKSGS